MNTLMLRRRLAYISAMVLLLVPLYFLGKPSVRRPDGSVIDQGGTLAQLRTRYDLGQSDLGEMDPASESMRLATLGLRGVAASILWQYAEYYKREQYWDRLSATLNQIAVLQPHFVKVWEFQAHNMSYNVSVEFDDYRQRYEWVKRGMNYLVKGAKYNKRRTEMPYELGWFFGNKFGVSDEKKQFRVLFRNDEDFHNVMLDTSGVDFTQRAARGPDGKPDNWLVGNQWYQKAYDMVDRGCKPAKSALMFYRMGPQWRIKFAEGIQEEGVLDYPARDAWERAGEAWGAFGQKQILTTYGDTIFLTELELANQEYSRLKEEFEQFCGTTFERLLTERSVNLTQAQLDALDKEEVNRTFGELILARQAQAALEVAPVDVAKATPEDIRVDAIRMAMEVSVAKEHIRHIESYRDQINYSYWAARCEAEQEESAMLARTNMYQANQLLDRGELDEALSKYEIAWQAWDQLFNAFPGMMVDDAADDVLVSINRYRRLLDTPDLPADFELNDFMRFRELYDDDLADPALMGVISAWPKQYPGRNFLEEMLRKTEGLDKSDLEARRALEDDAPPLPGRMQGVPVEGITEESIEIDLPGVPQSTPPAVLGEAPATTPQTPVAETPVADGPASAGVADPVAPSQNIKPAVEEEAVISAEIPEDAPPPVPAENKAETPPVETPPVESPPVESPPGEAPVETSENPSVNDLESPPKP